MQELVDELERGKVPYEVVEVNGRQIVRVLPKDDHDCPIHPPENYFDEYGY